MPLFSLLRRVRDSNPRYDVMRIPHFECGSFDHSDNSPIRNFREPYLFLFFEKRVQRYNKNLNCANNYAFFCTKEAILP